MVTAMGNTFMNTSTWTETDTVRALRIWEEYQQSHDLTDHRGQTAGIDPESGTVWFGKSAKDIVQQMEEQTGHSRPFYAVRVGEDFYARKGGRK